MASEPASQPAKPPNRQTAGPGIFGVGIVAQGEVMEGKVREERFSSPSS